MRQSSKLLSLSSIKELENSKNLLAFSAGVDSTALFFLLVNQNIEFDIAIVDYQVRKHSKDEVDYANELAERFNKKIYLHRCKLNGGNFEKSARDVRYRFFETLIQEKGYKNLITAHQLNDRLEWFLMQLFKGAGLVEILGFDEIEKRENYKIVRPLINSSKEELLAYLHSNNINYFLDETNEDISFKRNKIRKELSNDLIDLHKDGIKKSFSYLNEDKKMLFDYNPIRVKDLFIIEKSFDFIRDIDRTLKIQGYLLSKAQRDEIKRGVDLVVSDRYVIAFSEQFIYICPYSKINMPKEFKELCRILKIPAKIRPYLLKEQIDPKSLLF